MGVWRLGGGPWLLTFLRAKKEDHDRIRQFLAQFVDDYLAESFPQYLEVRWGGLYIALDGEQLVGTCVISLPKFHEAYLSGMRIAPSRQGQGLGEEFGRFQIEEARRLGAEVVRALVHADNELSAHVLQEKLGFHVVDQWAVGEINPIPVPDSRPKEAGPAWAIDQERLAQFVRRYHDDLWAPSEWNPTSLTMGDVTHRFGSGGVVLAPLTGEVEALALTQILAREVLHINYLRALGQALSSLLDHLWNEARAWGANRCRFGLSAHAAERLRALVPNTEIQWRGIVLERRLTLTASEG